jgi:hypothetical protein
MAIWIYQFTNSRQRTADSGLVRLAAPHSLFANVEREYGSETSGHLRRAWTRKVQASGQCDALRAIQTFVATKLEAFKGRGGADFLGSHDLEDVVSVVDGREALSAEVRDAGMDLSAYVRREIASRCGKPVANRYCPGATARSGRRFDCGCPRFARKMAVIPNATQALM